MTPLYEGQPGFAEMLPLLAERGFRPVCLEPILLDDDGLLMELDGAVRAGLGRQRARPRAGRGRPAAPPGAQVGPVAVALPRPVQHHRDRQRGLRGDRALGGGRDFAATARRRARRRACRSPRRATAASGGSRTAGRSQVRRRRRRSARASTSYWHASKRLNGGANTRGLDAGLGEPRASRGRAARLSSPSPSPTSSERCRARASRVRWSKPCSANATPSRRSRVERRQLAVGQRAARTVADGSR